MGHDDVTRAQSLVQLDGLGDPVGREGLPVVVSGIAANAERVQFLADLLGVIESPVVIGRVELDALVAHLRDAANRSHQVLFQFVANGVELEADGDVFIGGQSGTQRRCPEKGEK